jgi:DNA-binding CsgD family transcriptional regulator
MHVGETTDVIGRAAELAVVRGMVADIGTGRGGALLIEGEPGIGKSALLDAASAGAASAGRTVLRGRCDGLGQRFPLLVMTQLLQLEPGAADSWTVRIASVDPVAAAVEQLLAVVHRMCANGPVVLAVDDLHLADEASLLLWRRLCRESARLPVLVVGTCCPMVRNEELEQLRREMRLRPGGLLPLDRLAEESVAEFVRDLTGGVPGPRLRERLRSASGNPLYIRALTDSLLSSGALRSAAGVVELTEHPTADPGPALAGSLAGAIADRLDVFSADTREALRAAVMLGSEFSVSDLAAVLGCSPGSLLGPVEEALTAGVLESTASRLGFRHPLVKEALYQAMPTTLREVLRRHAAQVLIASGAPVERIAELVLLSPDTADDWELDWLADNAARLADRAPALAAALLNRGVWHTSAEDPRYAPMEQQLARVLYLTGADGRLMELAGGDLRRTDDPERVGRAWGALGFTAVRLQRYEQALAYADMAAADHRVTPLWRARAVDVVRASALGFLGRPDAEQQIRRALAEGERLGDMITTGYALHAGAVLGGRYGDHAQALDLIDRALALTGRDPLVMGLRVTLLGGRAAALDRLGRSEESAEATAQARSAAARIGSWQLVELLLREAERHFEHGHWDDALAVLDELGEPAQPHQRLIRQGILALIAGHRDQRRLAARHLDEAEVRATPPDPAATTAATTVGGGAVSSSASAATARLLMARSLAAERAGRPPEAVDALAVLLTSEYEGRMETRAEWLPALTRAALIAGDRSTAEAAAAACRQEAERAPLPRTRAAADWCRGLLDADPVPVLAAAEHHRSAGLRLGHANALEDAAVLHAANGQLDAARGLLAEALAGCADLGAAWDARRARARLRAHGVRVGAPGHRGRPRTGWDALTATELRVAELVAQGHSNPAIAERLLLSRRTVETHVSHILRKLRISSRQEVNSLAM